MGREVRETRIDLEDAKRKGNWSRRKEIKEREETQKRLKFSK